MHPSAKTKDFHGGEKGQFFPDFFFDIHTIFFQIQLFGRFAGKITRTKQCLKPEKTPRGPRTEDQHIFQQPADRRTQKPADRRTVVVVRRSAGFRTIRVFPGFCGVLCAVVTTGHTAQISKV